LVVVTVTSYTTHLAVYRHGSAVGCAADTVRVSVSLPRNVFDSLRLRADEDHLSISGEAATLIIDGLSRWSPPGGP
jgi:hypothetical protein